MADGLTCEVRYQGFVNVESSATVMPGIAQVEKAYALLKKPKAARKLHPLFARGFATDLTMRVSEAGIKVTVLAPDGMPVSVFDHPCHRVSYVIAIDKTMLFIALKPMQEGGDKSFKCHAFLTASPDTAKTLARHLTATCTAVFRKLQHSRKVLRKRAKAPSDTDLATALKIEATTLKSLQHDVQHELSSAADAHAAGSGDASVEFDHFADDFAHVSLSLQPQAAAAGKAADFQSLGKFADHEDGSSTLLHNAVNAGVALVFDEAPSLDSDYFSFGIDV